MNQDESLREHLRDLLRKGNAHIDFDGAIADLPVELRGAKHPKVPHTPWRIVEHMKIAQWDILQFCLNPNHVSPQFPDGYWPEGDAPPTLDAWERTIEDFRVDREAMITLVSNPRTDLFARIEHGEGQTIFKEALVVADHNAYHLGQLIVLRRLLGDWEE